MRLPKMFWLAVKFSNINYGYMFKKLFFYCLIAQLTLISCKDKKANADSKEVVMKEEKQPAKISFENDRVAKKIAVKINGEVFTNYIYDGQTPKPILYPILTKSGKTVTRGFPFEPRLNERVDHPHHAGHWFNYGDVNGLDFWNNSYAIPEKEKHKYGSIFHTGIVESDESKGSLTIAAEWKTPESVTLLEETTQFIFGEEGNTRTIDRITTLKALQDVSFTDNKEGLIAIRVARELELPSDKPALFTDSEGNVTEVKALNNEGVKGNYFASEGLTGDAVWGTRNRWVKLESTMEDEPVSITIIDNRKNVGYPTYWHARGYGLFAANPLGQAIFSEGKEKLNFKLNQGESVTFKYRILVHDGSELTKEAIEKSFEDFNKE